MTKNKRRLKKKRIKRWARRGQRAAERRINEALFWLSDGAAGEISSRSANWPTNTVRFFALDCENGHDGNSGNANTPDEAVSRAVQSMDRLREIVPRQGNGRSMVIMIKGGHDGRVRNRNGTHADLHLDVAGYTNVSVRGFGGRAPMLKNFKVRG